MTNQTPSKFQQEMEAQYPGYIVRTLVAAATRQALLSRIPFSYHNAQGL